MSKWRQFLKFVLPSVVLIDTVRSCIVVSQLAKKRMEEWEEENNQHILVSTRDILQKIALRCHVSDTDFWPRAVSSRAGINTTQLETSEKTIKPHISNSTNTIPSIIDPFAQLLTAQSIMKIPPSNLDKYQNASTTTSSSHSHNHPEHFETDTRTITSSSNYNKDDKNPSKVEYVTLEDCWTHLVQTLHLLSTTAASQSRVVHAVSEHHQRLQSAILSVVDEIGSRLRRSSWLPELTVKRRSALRYSIFVHGFAQYPTGWEKDRGLVQCVKEIDLSSL